VTVYNGTAGNDTLTGGAGKDVLTGGAGADRLNGGGDDDVIHSARALGTYRLPLNTNPWTAPTLDTGTEVDVIDGGAGDDLISAGYGDRIDGGVGFDTLIISFAGASAGVTADFSGVKYQGVAQVTVGATIIRGIEAIDWIEGSAFGDVIQSSVDSDGPIFGMGGDDRIISTAWSYGNVYGGTGNDWIDATGNGYSPYLYGEEGDDTILASNSRTFGGAGNDTLTGSWLDGGAGNDLLQGRYHGRDGRLYGGDGNDRINGSRGRDIVAGGQGADIIRGGEGNDSLYAAETEDADNGSAIDVIDGGAGDDFVAIGYGDRANGGEGIDRVALYLGGATSGVTMRFEKGDLTGDGSIVNFEVLELASGSRFDDNLTLGAFDENVMLSGGYGDERLTATTSSAYLLGSAGDDILIGGTARDSLDGGADNDTLVGGAGDDWIVGDDGDDLIEGGTGNDEIIGGAGMDTVSYAHASGGVEVSVRAYAKGADGNDSLEGIENAIGSAFNDQLFGDNWTNVLDGGAGDDMLNGGSGADRMIGGTGNDRFVVDNVGDVVVELAGQGYDTVEASISYSIASMAVEALVLTGGATDGTGNDLSNNITGNDRDNRIDGGGGNDEIRAGSGKDVLIGGAGNDRLYGGEGGDLYEDVDSSDLIVELANEGLDSISTRVARFTLVNNVERLIFTGAGSFYGTGNAQSNYLEALGGANHILDGGAGNDTLNSGAGNDMQYGRDGHDQLNGGAGNDNLGGGEGDDRLDGGLGADLLQGGAGDDVYIVDNVGDRTNELAGDGYDRVEASVTWTLALHVEQLKLTGNAAINATGNAQANDLIGNARNNVLDGREGADSMAGGQGNDSYYVDNVGDVVTEAAYEGTDTVYSSLDYVLGDNVEWLWLTGSAVSGTGNALDNRLLGNDGANVLDGKYGADMMWGGRGNDTYYVDTVDDVVNESANAGTDLVYSSVDYTLGANVEWLWLTGSAVEGTGNALDNRLFGNDRDNVLNGQAGADMMWGGRGADTYIVDNVGDVINESSNPDIDTVISSVSYTLGAYVEGLVLTGSAAINGTGNALENVIGGNDGANMLNGGGGSDLLTGGLGVDVLTGGEGADLFYFDSMGPLHADRITDFSAADDLIVLDSWVFEGLYDLSDDEGVLSADAFRTGSRASDASDRIIYNSGTGELFYDADGTGAIAQLLFARVSSGLSMSAGDFVVY
jgi:Ca2+-binding RTX toxin-like protein